MAWLKTIHSGFLYLFCFASKDTGRRNILNVEFHQFFRGILWSWSEKEDRYQSGSDGERSYHQDRSLASLLWTSWKVAQCHWLSWLTPGNCTDFLSPVLWKNFPQKGKKKLLNNKYFSWVLKVLAKFQQ